MERIYVYTCFPRIQHVAKLLTRNVIQLLVGERMLLNVFHARLIERGSPGAAHISK